MRALLINPFYPVSETPSPPLGLAYLGAALEKAGIETRILDFVVFPYGKESVESALKTFSPHMVGVTSVTMSHLEAEAVIRDVKRLNGDILTVMGGPHVTFCAEATLTGLPELDVVVLGEGEGTFVKLSAALEKGRSLETVQGIVFRSGGELIRTRPKTRPMDVNELREPARHLVPLGRYRALGMPISMTTSRGCPFQCIFCVGRKMAGAKMRYRHARKVVDELALLSTLGFHQINIADDLFTADKTHCLSVCSEILDRGLKVDWTAFARVDTVSKDLLVNMRKAGCHTVSFGIESANAAILKTIKKGITLRQVETALAACMDAGITAQASFILGLPGETPETLKETVDFGKKLKKMGVHHGFHLLAPFPGTEVREKCDQYGIRILTHDWSQYHANRAIAETPAVSRCMLDAVVVEWENRFNEWLGDVDRRRALNEASPDEAWQLRRLEHTVLIYDLMMAKTLEKTEPCREAPSVSDRAALAALGADIADSLDCSQQQVVETLTFALDNGNLKRHRRDGLSHWAWVDYLCRQ